MVAEAVPEVIRAVTPVVVEEVLVPVVPLIPVIPVEQVVVVETLEEN